MLLKRKRSDDELSSFSSGGTGHGYSSPLPSDNGDIDMVMMDTDIPLSPKTVLSPAMQNRSRSSTPSYLPSRTFKRLRNGRPSDDEVHQNTLKMLYQAQHSQPQQPQHHFVPPPQAVSMPSSQPPATPVQNQPSLHNFWKISAAPKSPSSPFSHSSTAPLPSIDAVVERPTTCEDCGVGLGGEDATMDDGYGFETYINTCSSCSKAVCFSCSISNLGEQRRCLACAGGETSNMRKKWVGGTGWTSEPMTVY
ncbi:hypothetical protein VM1G_05687 [Cytospora mali]|uniref:Uncharacterized protein n=1 Tax=Cytospora mali TaxID=578113 RepID=A0A194W257_CYTMA|nr:hypothetical protein VM1G_05687 [Valsa mali]